MARDQIGRFWEVVHRMLVIFDDWLCEEFKFSRKAKGKHVPGYRAQGGEGKASY